MKLSDLKPWIPWIVLAVVIAVVGFFAKGYLDGLRGRAETAERQAKAAELRADGFAAARDATRKQLEDQVAGNAILAAEIERLQKKAPGSVIVGSVTGSTGWFQLTPPTLPPGTPGQPAPRVCMIWSDEMLDIRAKGALARTPEGVLVGAGVASLWVLSRGLPEVKAQELPLRMELSALPPTPSPGWGFGGVISGFIAPGTAGWWAGPRASPPPFRLLGVDWTGDFAVGAGPGGVFGGQGGFLGR